MTTKITCVTQKVELAQLQALVGGYVIPVRIAPHADEVLLLVDEDGEPKGLPLNPAASIIAKRPIVGDAVLLYGEGLESWK